jgi:hypothetical protein
MLAALAINAAFAARGRAAAYTPPGGGSPIPCIVINDAGDCQAVGGLGRPILRGNILKVRKSEIPTPARGGTFAIDGGETLKVASDPENVDAERLVWSFTVT